MNAIRSLILFLVFALALFPSFVLGNPDNPLRVLVVTGGHDFEPEFHSMFEGYGDIVYDKAEHPNANPLFEDGRAMKYDVVVLYDMNQAITDKQKEGFKAYLQAGKGLVSLHHSLANYQDWPEYIDIIGGTYVLNEKGKPIDGKLREGSTYRHDVDIDVEIADPSHPVTQGVSDFTVFDEVYGKMYVQPDAHALLKTDHKESNPVIGWTKNYGKARVAALQPGHGRHGFANWHFRRLVAQAIRWTANRPSPKPLIQGVSLSGWKQEGDARWDFESGLLVGRQGPNRESGDLLTEKEYSDFELTVEMKMVWPGNSGVWFRYQSADQAYQADMLEYTNPLCWSGSLYCTGKMFIALNEDPKLVNREGWNTFVIRCEDNRTRVWLNGTKTADVFDSTSAKGRIGFQIHAGDEFKDMAITARNVEIIELN